MCKAKKSEVKMVGPSFETLEVQNFNIMTFSQKRLAP